MATLTESAFSDLIGQSSAVELLTQAIARDRIAPAYLFVGAHGIGKRRAANSFVKLLLQCDRSDLRNHPDLFWVEPTYLHQNKRYTATEAEAEGIKRKSSAIVRLDQIREITQFLSRPPLESARSVVVIEGAETMPEAAANALLKTLEEPGRATLILLAPTIDALLPTLISRSQRIPFYRLSQADVAMVLTQTGHEEILSQPEILDLAQGSPGDAIVQWETLQTLDAELLQQISQLPTNVPDALRFAKQIAKALDTETQIWLIDYLQQTWWRDLTRRGLNGDRSIALFQQLEQAKNYLKAYVQPQLVWEVTLMNCCPPVHTA